METATRAYNRVAAQGQRDQLILAHLPLVRHVLGKLIAGLPPGVDVENLEAAGVLGLVEAANGFDPERGTQFKTFAYLRIRGAVLDELRRNCPLPQHVLERIALVRQAHESLPAPVSVEALAAATGLTADEVADCLAAVRLTRMLSWEGAGEPVGIRLDGRDHRPDTEAERAELQQVLADGIESLPERERLAVTLYYMEDLRLKEIGEVLGLSESRVSRVLSAALFRLGEYIRAREG
ncbi:MAG TPA: sigma-70 family RNA polymerase sigma factor [Gemmataceae bacterium]|nr:sigma-70 family RNA polymerase sigma factor [Gemmataceae bacterium]